MPILSTCVIAYLYSYCLLEDGRFYSTIRESETTMNVYIDQQLIGSVINGVRNQHYLENVKYVQ